MAELRPYPLAALVTRMLRELDSAERIFDLPARKFHSDDGGRDLSVVFHGMRAASPLGPAAGPHTQMAQNLVLSWLGGARIFELKTVQKNDQLDIPRPCIDMQTIGYNVEWSQELRVAESLEEYVKGAMLIEILRNSAQLPPAACDRRIIFDTSVGYDLDGIRSDKVSDFLSAMRDCSATLDRLRAQIPAEHAALRDLDFPSQLSRSVTLSTFHGCPPDEIERIIEHLLTRVGVSCVVKLNPMLLGAERTRELLGEVMGYRDLHVPDSAFEQDTSWQQAVDFVGRLDERARGLGLGFGVKFSNTLIVENHRDFFPASEKVMYLSGPPLHVLAMSLVRKFRGQFGASIPISFSAGIDRSNFADAVALGLVPITVCSDLLKPGGYGRASAYLADLIKRMAGVGAGDIPEYIIRCYGLGSQALDSLGIDASDSRYQNCRAALEQGQSLAEAAGDLYARWVSAAVMANTEQYVPQAIANPRYHQARNSKAPRKLGTHLALFDCVTCDKCVPVCPNNANFALPLTEREISILHASKSGANWTVVEAGTLVLTKPAQYANFADFCNDCGNCDVFCPEDGGPYRIKPRFFRTRNDWEQFGALDGFHMFREGDAEVTLARIDGHAFEVRSRDGRVHLRGDGFDVEFDPADPAGSLSGTAAGQVDLSYVAIVDWLREGVTASGAINYVSCAGELR